MKLLVGFALIGFILIIIGCSTNFRTKRFASLPATDDQCRILSEKRNFKPQKSYGRRHADRKSEPAEARLAFTHLKETPVVTYNLSLPTLTDITREFKVSESINVQSPSSVESNHNHIVNEETLNPAASQKYFATPGLSQTASHTSWWFYGVSAVAGLCSMAGIALFKERSRKLAGWSARNPLTARTAITTIHVVTGSAACAGGYYLANAGLTSDPSSAYASMGLFGMAALAYPMKKVKHGFFSDGFLRRKMHDVALAVSGLCLMFHLGQSVDMLPTDVVGRFVVEASQERPVHEWPMGGKIALTVLIVAVMAAAAYFLAALACGLSCNGYGVLAGVVLLGGAGGLILAFATLMRRIFRHDKFLEKKKARRERRALRKAGPEAKTSLVPGN